MPHPLNSVQTAACYPGERLHEPQCETMLLQIKKVFLLMKNHQKLWSGLNKQRKHGKAAMLKY